jgi:hypothetical protein
MRSTKNPAEVIWEFVPDHDYREKMRQAFAIILGSDIRGVDMPPFDETEILKQDEGASNG